MEIYKWMFDKFLKAFPALRYKNYQLYFSGQLISLIGTWLQMVAQGWLVLQLTNSAFWVGLVSAIGTLPVFLFSLFGGVIADRLPKKKILLFTQISAMILAIILGILTFTKNINLAEIVFLALLLGIVNALDIPSRQSFTIEMVGKDTLGSAIALNSGAFNGARVIGPAIAGIVIALFGIAGAFLINGISYIAVIIALIIIQVKEFIPQIHPHPLDSIKEGLSYSFSHSIIKKLLLFTAMTSIFGWSYITIMPVVVQNIFHKNASFLGYFYSASGVGALLGSIFISIISNKVNPTKIIMIGNTLFILSMFLFTFTTNLYLALMFLFFAGFGLLMQTSTTNNLIQHSVENALRGRVMSIYALMFMGMTPVGSFQIGLFAQNFGPLTAIRIGAIVLFSFGLILYFNKTKKLF